MPTWRHERAAAARGYRLLAGVDEAGRGALAGPVVAAAVILPRPDDGRRRGRRPYQDSKTLSPARRETLAALVREEARPGDLVVFLGAGDITQWAYALPGQLEALG